MSNHSDFSSHGYEIIRELGRNREGGRIAYLATVLNSKQQVVIKEFRFAIADAKWSGFKAYQREIEILQQLNHPRIPRYLDSFETPQGFCLVQEYKNARSLAERRSFTVEEIKQIAVSVLQILMYLQKRTPPVIHRDIKPENILVDKQLNAYLIDFGFARIRSGQLALSSVAAGTIGFMPPEEQFGRSLTEASDLYSLGATLICLLTGTRSADVGKLIDENYRFEFKKLVPKLKPRFVDWLTKMVEPNLKNRYSNAAVALAVLNPMDVVSSTTWLEIIERDIEPSITITVFVVGLATIGIFTVVGMLTYQSEKVVNIEAPQLSPTPTREIVVPANKSVRDWDLEGNRLWNLGHYEQALAAYDKALEINPKSGRILVRRCQLLNHLDRYQEARITCDRALKLNPNSDRIWVNHCWALRELAEYQKALNSCNKALEINPGSAWAWNEKGILLTTTGRYKEALACFNKVLQIEPNNQSAIAYRKYVLKLKQKP